MIPNNAGHGVLIIEGENQMPRTLTPIRTALYYPYPFIQSDTWLKAAVLFWDSLYRIIPAGFRYMIFHDTRVFEPSPFSRLVSDEFDFVKDYELERHPPIDDPSDTARAGAALAELMRTRPDFFIKRMDEGDEYFTWGLHEYYKAGTDALTEHLRALGAFAPTSGRRWSEEFRFRSLPGRVYMALLVKQVAEKHGLPVVTDDEEHDQILHLDVTSSQKERYELLDGAPIKWRPPVRLLGLPASTSSLDFALCRLTFQGIGVENLENVPPAKIVSIRKRYDAERRAFFDEVHSIVNELQESGIESTEFVAGVLEDRAAKFNQARTEYTKVLKAEGLQTFFSLLRASVSLPIADLLGKHLMLSEPLSVAIAATAGAISVGAVLHNTHLARVKERLAKPTAFYLFQVGKRLN